MGYAVDADEISTSAVQLARQGLAGQGGASTQMSAFPLGFAPHYVDALGSIAAGIAAAIAGAIAVRVFGAKHGTTAPAAARRPTASAGGRESEPAPVDRSAPPPARVRLALPPEERAEPESETDSRLRAVDGEAGDAPAAADGAPLG